MHRSRKYFIWAWLGVVLHLLLGCAAVDTVQNGTEPIEALSADLRHAKLAFNSGKYAAALYQYSKILERDKNNCDALVGVGRIYAQVDQQKLALEYFSRALEINPEDAGAAEARGLAYFKLHKREAALADFQQALKRDPDRWQSWNGLGILSDLNGNSAEARGYYYRALEILPDSPTLINNIGYSFLMDGDYTQAESILRKGLVKGFDDVLIHNNLSMAIAWQGRYEEAVQIMDGILPKYSALNNVGYIALSRGDIEIAKQFFHNALEVSPSYYLRAAQNLSIADSMAVIE